MAQYMFGSGILWGIPTATADGTVIATNASTPIQFGVLQEVSVDISFDTKMLHGQNQFPVAIGRGKGKVSGSAKFAQMNGQTLNSLFFGQTLNTGLVADVYDTAGVAIPGTPFTITPTVPSSGTWSVDLGVRNAAGLPMTRVASAPATGQYSASAGVYTFAAADTGLVVYINYQYTATVTGAKKATIANLPMGYAPTFRLDLSSPFSGKHFTLTLLSCVGSKLGIATKQDDFIVPDFGFEAFADSAGNVMTWSTSE